MHYLKPLMDKYPKQVVAYFLFIPLFTIGCYIIFWDSTVFPIKELNFAYKFIGYLGITLACFFLYTSRNLKTSKAEKFHKSNNLQVPIKATNNYLTLIQPSTPIINKINPTTDRKHKELLHLIKSSLLTTPYLSNKTHNLSILFEELFDAFEGKLESFISLCELKALDNNDKLIFKGTTADLYRYLILLLNLNCELNKPSNYIIKLVEYYFNTNLNISSHKFSEAKSEKRTKLEKDKQELVQIEERIVELVQITKRQ